MAYLSELNQRQVEAVKAVEGPVMVIAGPGSGKTRVLTTRIAHLIQMGVPAYRILALTFTNKAASEMKERIVGIVGEKSRQLWMGTFHSVFARILRSECGALGFNRNFTIYDTADSLGAVKNIMNARGIPPQRFNPQAIRSRISAAKNQMIRPAEFAQQSLDLFGEKAALVYTDYVAKLRANNAMDFDDLLLLPIDLFRGNRNVLDKYQDLFRFILVDEYQDTNRTQYVLIRTLAEKYRNVCVVGDDAQSIYAFRGADIRNILDFQKDYPDVTMIRLEQNYRSTGSILAAADHLIKHNVDQIEKHLWTENPGGDPITHLTCEDDRDEGERIAAKIFDESRRMKIDLKDIAIMYRTNAQSRSLEDALRRNSIPYLIVGGVEFYQRKEVKDALAYLRVLVNPSDEESLLRILNYPARGIGDVARSLLRDFAAQEKCTLAEAAARGGEIAGLSPRVKKSLDGFSRMLAKYGKLKETVSPSELSRAYIEETGILTLLKEEGTAESLERWQNVQELLSAIMEMSARREDATLEAFLQDVSLVAAVDTLDAGRNAVTLMTLHSAKGLEFPLVFISGLEEGLLPLYTASPERKEIEEERRLLYVGVTRAMKKLYLTSVRLRIRFGETSFQSPSRFLDDLPPDVVEAPLAPSRRQRTAASWNAVPAAAAREQRTHASRREPGFEADEMPDYENHSDVQESLRSGKLVMHVDFGRGKVLTVSGAGDAMKAVVEFETVGRKNLMVKYAKLRLL